MYYTYGQSMQYYPIQYPYGAQGYTLAPQPWPGSQPLPGPQPMPGPQPWPGPQPLPGPQPMPGPQPWPGPQPLPGPQPMPGPQPWPGPQPMPGPQPWPGPQPLPGPFPPYDELTYLENVKSQLIQQRKQFAEIAKQLEESMTNVDERIEKLKAERKKTEKK